MKASGLLTAVVTLAILRFGGTTVAGPPYVTDDPEPVDYQHWEFYLATQDSDFRRDWSGTAPHFELNYGVAPEVQLHLIAPLAYDVPPAGAAHYGLADVELGVKYRFVQETNWLPQVGVFPMLELPTGSAHNNLGNGHLQAFLPLWLQKSWGAWTSYGGGGYGVNSFSGNQNWRFFGAVLQNQVMTNLAVGLEIYHQDIYQSDFPNRGTAFNFGAVYDFTDQHHLLFSAGRSFGSAVRFQCYLAYQYTFDNSIFHPGKHGPEGSPP